MPAETTITTEQQVALSLTPTTATGHPATVDGQATFEVQSGSCTIQQLDALNAMIISGDSPGDSTILVSADADLGAGVQTIQDVAVVHVEGAMATSLGLGFGQPQPKP